MAPPGGNAEQPDVVYGFHAIREVLRARRRPLQRLLVIRQDGQFRDLIRLAKEAGVPVQVQPRSALERFVPEGKHQGVVGVVGAKALTDLEDLIDFSHRQPQAPAILMLDGLEDPHNLGAILRTAECAGIHGVVIPQRRSVGLTSTVAKVSAGAVEYVPVASVTNLSRTIERFKREGLWVYGFDPEASTSYIDLDFRGPVALVFGGEGMGLRPGVLSNCDDKAFIPMYGKVQSLNVSAACSIVLYELVRQRRAGV